MGEKKKSNSPALWPKDDKVHKDSALAAGNVLHICLFTILEKVTVWQRNELFDHDLYSGGLPGLLGILSLHPKSWRQQVRSWMENEYVLFFL